MKDLYVNVKCFDILVLKNDSCHICIGSRSPRMWAGEDEVHKDEWRTIVRRHQCKIKMTQA